MVRKPGYCPVFNYPFYEIYFREENWNVTNF